MRTYFLFSSSCLVANLAFAFLINAGAYAAEGRFDKDSLSKFKQLRQQSGATGTPTEVARQILETINQEISETTNTDESSERWAANLAILVRYGPDSVSEVTTKYIIEHRLQVPELVKPLCEALKKTDDKIVQRNASKLLWELKNNYSPLKELKPMAVALKNVFNSNSPDVRKIAARIQVAIFLNEENELIEGLKEATNSPVADLNRVVEKFLVHNSHRLRGDIYTRLFDSVLPRLITRLEEQNELDISEIRNSSSLNSEERRAIGYGINERDRRIKRLKKIRDKQPPFPLKTLVKKTEPLKSGQKLAGAEKVSAISAMIDLAYRFPDEESTRTVLKAALKSNDNRTREIAAQIAARSPIKNHISSLLFHRLDSDISFDTVLRCQDLFHILDFGELQPSMSSVRPR